MKQEIKEKWVAALRSGEYQQTTGNLRDEKGFCCLGVLTDLYLKENGVEWVSESAHPYAYYLALGICDELPKQVADWAGLECNCNQYNCNPYVEVPALSSMLALSQLNDGIDDLPHVKPYNFDQIANLIETTEEFY
ncbi:hypothetical protein b3_0085 [Synechococcus phage B3]|nr:hypothetical protein b3_0085 [Synechococcus phage B3]QGT54699.1 hypothetical protein b23_0084 [Synechococcus phage B23]